MTIEVKVPRLAESISDATLVQWLKPDGATVRVDEPIATLETDKAAVELPAEASGVLRHGRRVGDRVEVGDVIARIENGTGAETAEPRPETRPMGAARAAEASPAPKPAPAPAPPVATSTTKAPPAAKGADDLSPAVRRMVEEHRLDPGAIRATGPGGRLLKEDVQGFVDARAARETAAAPAPPSPAARPSPTPAPAAPVPATAATLATGAPTDWHEGEEERAVPMSRIRQRIAERLVKAQQTAAILTTFNEVDMGAVMELRNRFKEDFEKRHGVRLSFMSFFARACVLALQQIPEINAEIRGTHIVYKRHVHMGVAVQTPRGLVVPIVHHADRRSFADLEREIARLAMAARENRLTLAELSGGTFTLSNGGVFGSLLSTPILNPPQSGILGMHKIEKRPVVVDDEIVIRSMMYLALSYDHRVVDGQQAVTFLVSIKERLEDPERMLLDV